MTPSALTPAARRSSTDRTGHRDGILRHPVTPRAPRRVSGPAAGRTATTRRPAGLPLASRLVALARALPDHSLLDRIVRGRMWIPLLGVLLVGIVAMQVEVLKLNAGIGQAIERVGTLQGENQQLEADVAKRSNPSRIEAAAATQGFSVAGAAQTELLSPGSPAKAISTMRAPDPTGFLARLQASKAAAAVAENGGSSSSVATASTQTGATADPVTSPVAPTATTAATAPTGATATTAAGG